VDDARLCENGGVQFGTIGYYNWFGAYLSNLKEQHVAARIKFDKEKQRYT
jgi:hypothetical protein